MKKLLSQLLILLVGSWVGHAATEIPLDPIYKANPAVIRPRGEVIGFCNPDTTQKALSCFFNFTQCPDNNMSFIRYDVDKKFSGRPEKLIWHIYANAGAAKTALTAWFVDSSDEIYLSRREVNWRGWKKVEFPVPANPAWPSGDKNNRIDLPLKLLGIAVDRTGDNQIGTVMLGNWSLLTDLSQGNPFVMNVELPQYIWGNEVIELKTVLHNYAKRDIGNVTAKINISDRYYSNKVVDKVIKFTGATAERAINKIKLDLPYGSYDVTVDLYDGNKLLDSYRAGLQRFLGDCGKMSPEVVAFEMRWSPVGGVWGFMDPELANRFGARWNRFEGPNWESLEKNQGYYDPTEVAKSAAEHIKFNTRPIVLQTLYAYPKFYDPKKLPEFAHGYGMAMKHTAAALKPYTSYFELGNEDNGHSKFMYTEVARNGAAAIRSQQPFATLSNSGTAGIDLSWVDFQRKRQLFDYLDAICVHPYTNNSTPSQEVSAEKSFILEKLEDINGQVDRMGGMKEIWTTEFGWPNSDAKGEIVRADLYLREMAVCDAAGMQLDGIYTFKRDYGVVDFPAGPAVNAYNIFRAGHRFVGLIVEGPVWTAVYEKGGEAFALVWTPDAATQPLKVDGKAYFDMFGNPLEKSAVKISQSPIFVKDVAPQILKQAVEENCKKKKQFALNCLKNTGATGWSQLAKIAPTDSKAIQNALTSWAGKNGKIIPADKAVVSRLLDWYLNASRLSGTTYTGGDTEKLREQLRQIVEKAHGLEVDVPGLRYLLNQLDRVIDERKLAEKDGKTNYAKSCQAQETTICKVAERFTRNEVPFQFAVFSAIYMKKGNELQEHITFVPGDYTHVQARVTSYSAKPQTVTVRPELPSGWTADPASLEVKVDANSCATADFRIKAGKSEKNISPIIRMVTSMEGKPDNITVFDDTEIVPAVKLEILPVGYNLNKEPLRVVVINQEGKKISGKVRLLQSGTAGNAIAEFDFINLRPFSRKMFAVKPAEIPETLHPDWSLNAEVLLSDGRRFSLPAKIDFTVAVEAPENIKIDADFKDWSTALPLKINREEYSFGSYGGAWSPGDCSADTWLMWDKKYLYFGAIVKDQTFNQQYEGDSMWKQDSIQIIFAANRNAKYREFTLAVTAAGPRVWDTANNNYLKGGIAAIKYDGKTCFYEVAIPWSTFDAEFLQTVKNGKILYAIAINDDDVIGSRHFMERFPETIIHGRELSKYAEVMFATPENSIKTDKVDPNQIMKEDFNRETPGQTPSAWKYLRNNLPENTMQVVKGKGIGNTTALRLENKVGSKPHHFTIMTLPLQGLKSGEKYLLEVQVKGMRGDSGSIVGMCSDNWGNCDFCYAKWTPSNEWQKVIMPFTAPMSGNYNVIVRNAEDISEMFIDDIRVLKQP